MALFWIWVLAGDPDTLPQPPGPQPVPITHQLRGQTCFHPAANLVPTETSSPPHLGASNRVPQAQHSPATRGILPWEALAQCLAVQVPTWPWQQGLQGALSLETAPCIDLSHGGGADLLLTENEEEATGWQADTTVT